MSEQEKVVLPEVMVFADPFRIFKKRKEVYYRWENPFWNRDAIARLTGVATYSEHHKA